MVRKLLFGQRSPDHLIYAQAKLAEAYDCKLQYSPLQVALHKYISFRVDSPGSSVDRWGLWSDS